MAQAHESNEICESDSIGTPASHVITTGNDSWVVSVLPTCIGVVDKE